MKRDIDGPSLDWLTPKEAADYLRLDLTHFREYVAEGYVFGERMVTRENILYPWRAIVAFQIRFEFGDIPALAELRKSKRTGRTRPQLDLTGEELDETQA